MYRLSNQGMTFFGRYSKSRSACHFPFTTWGLRAGHMACSSPLTLTYGLRWDVDFAPFVNPGFPGRHGIQLE